MTPRAGGSVAGVVRSAVVREVGGPSIRFLLIRGGARCRTALVARIAGDLYGGKHMRALIFDLDGTLVDTVYAHVFTWQQALAEAGMPIDGWRIHRRIGMSGGLFARAVARERGRPLSKDESDALPRRHAELFEQLMPERRPLPGAGELLRHLREAGVLYGVATSGARPGIDSSLEALGIGPYTVVIERGDVARAKPEPDLFLACA